MSLREFQVVRPRGDEVVAEQIVRRVFEREVKELQCQAPCL
jgi:hypothetical protein